MPYLPEKVYAELRRLSMLQEQLTEDRNRNMNRLHREMKIYFPEYKDAFKKIDGAFCMAVLKEAPFPEDILKLGAEGIREIWHQAKLRGRGYSRAAEIVKYAETSIGLKDGTAAGREAVRWFTEKIMELDEELEEIENRLKEKCKEIPHAENVMEIPGIGGKIFRVIYTMLKTGKPYDSEKLLKDIQYPENLQTAVE